MTRRLFWLQNRPETRCSAQVRPTILTQSYGNFGLNRGSRVRILPGAPDKSRGQAYGAGTCDDRLARAVVRVPVLVDRRCLILPQGWVEVAELDACVVGGELPVDLALAGVDLVLPGSELSVQEFDVA